MAKFAFRGDPDKPIRANLHAELRGHEYAMEGMSRQKFEDVTNSVDKAQGDYDVPANPYRGYGFDAARRLQHAQAILHRRKSRTKLAPD